MLGKLIALAVLLGLIYFVATEGMSWLGKQTGTSSSSDSFEDDGGASYCVDAAFAANDRLGDSIRQFGRPGTDVDAWSSAMWEVESAMNEASSSCTCPSDACSKATEALSEMGQQLSSLDDLVQGTATGYGNPARQQERIVDLLNEARSWI